MKGIETLPLKERIRRQLELSAVDQKKRERIVEILEAHPELEELMNLMREVGAY